MNNENRVIARHCQNDPKVLRDTLHFITASIRESFYRVPTVLENIRRDGSQSTELWGFKRDSYEYVIANYPTLHGDALRALNNNDMTAMMFVFLRVPGLGLAKAGFACQLFCGRVGCIDTHNVKLYNVSPNVLTLNKSAKEITQRRRIEAYIDLCYRCGGSELLWDAWCDLIAVRQATHWKDGEHVSKAHADMCVR